MISLVKHIIHRNFLLRLLLLAVMCIPLVYSKTFYEHFASYLTGTVADRVIREQWRTVFFNILLFLAFLIPLSFRRKVRWSEYGLVSAFIVSLFFEMYGIPFTILLAQKWFYQATIQHPITVLDFHFQGVFFGMDIPMAYGAGLIIIGVLLVIAGWITLYFGIKKKNLVTNGIYSFSRHPQYLGFILLIGGWFIGWPTLLTIILSPILILKYIRVAQHEEKEIPDLIEYNRYKERVPFFI